MNVVFHSFSFQFSKIFFWSSCLSCCWFFFFQIFIHDNLQNKSQKFNRGITEILLEIHSKLLLFRNVSKKFSRFILKFINACALKIHPGISFVIYTEVLSEFFFDTDIYSNFFRSNLFKNFHRLLHEVSYETSPEVSQIFLWKPFLYCSTNFFTNYFRDLFFFSRISCSYPRCLFRNFSRDSVWKSFKDSFRNFNDCFSENLPMFLFRNSSKVPLKVSTNDSSGNSSRNASRIFFKYAPGALKY